MISLDFFFHRSAEVKNPYLFSFLNELQGVNIHCCTQIYIHCPGPKFSPLIQLLHNPSFN